MALLAILASAGSAAAVAPASPPPNPVTPPGSVVIQEWVDVKLPPDTPAGRKVTIGITLWDPLAQKLSRIGKPYLRIHAATGKAVSEQVLMQEDWPGHQVATVAVPTGGIGRIEAGLVGHDCDASGTCHEETAPFTFGGYGPPPDARRTDLVVASIEDLPRTLSVGDTVTVTADLVPNADWGLDALALPDRLVLEAAPPRGTDLAQVDLQQSQPFDGSYHGSLTIPNGSDILLRVSLPAADGGPGETFPAVVHLAVLGATDESAAPAPTASGVAPASPAAPGPDIPWIPIVLVAAVILGGGYVLTRVLGDL